MRLIAPLLLMSTLCACAPGLKDWSDAALIVRARTDNGRCQVQVVFGPTGPDFVTAGVRARINGKDAWYQTQGVAAHRDLVVSSGKWIDVIATGFQAQTQLEAELDTAETLEVVLDDGFSEVRTKVHNVCRLNQFTLEGDAARQYRAGERFTLIAHPLATWSNPLAFSFTDGSTQTVPLVDGRAELTVPMNIRNTNFFVSPKDSAALPTPSSCEGAASCVVEPYPGFQNQASVSVLLAP